MKARGEHGLDSRLILLRLNISWVNIHEIGRSVPMPATPKQAIMKNKNKNKGFYTGDYLGCSSDPKHALEETVYEAPLAR